VAGPEMRLRRSLRLTSFVLTAVLACCQLACTGGGSASSEASTPVVAGVPSQSRTPSPATSISPSPSPSPSAFATPAPSPPVEEEPFLPDPDRPVPQRARKLAAELELVSDALAASIEEWVSTGDPSKRSVPLDVRLQALYQQRIYRAMVAAPTLADGTIGRLPSGLAKTARANVDAGASILSLVHAIPSATTIRTNPPPPAGDLREWFGEAEDRFDVDWELLAAVMFVESKFGRVRSASSAGAQGPMQFLTSTCAAYGLGGDIQDPRDAILGAANYLHASGAPERERAALYAYNHAWAYVDAIQAYAGRIRKDPDAYYAYYNWQVFVLTTRGAVRLTGPGL
jgi:hypothetical protein